MLQGGFVGVDVFFVISGFVITGLLLRERVSTGRTKIVAFYGRRARRIIPSAAFVIVTALIVERIVGGIVDAHIVSTEARFAIGFIANFDSRSVNDIFLVRPEPLQPYWSLAVEEQFYIVYPLLFLLAAVAGTSSLLRARVGTALLVVIALSFGWALTGYGTHFSLSSYVSPISRAWELAFGGLLALAGARFRAIPKPMAAMMTWIGLIGIVLCSIVLRLDTPYPGLTALLPVVATGLIIAGGTALPRHGAEVLLKQGPFKWMGRWSYAMYLWHYATLTIGLQILYKSQDRSHILVNISLMCVAVVLSAGTYFLIENPIRHSDRLNQSPRASIVMGSLMVGMCLLMTFVV